MLFLYNIFIQLYYAVICLASFANKKASLWLLGRKKWEEELKKKIPANQSVIWFHCASLGEFEQGRTLIETFKRKNPEQFILLTFFSPSGYEVRKDYAYADYVCYLPIDTKKNARKFLEIVRPEMAIFVKYEYWFNYINELHNKKIKIVFISTIFNSNSYFFKWYGSWFLKQIKKVDYFFVQNENSFQILKKHNFRNVVKAGDTRFDRVFELANGKKDDNIIKQFSSNKKLVIAGSTWPQDEKLLLDSFPFLLQNNMKLVIAPHLVNSENINRISNEWKQFKIALYTTSSSIEIENSDVLIVDCIGKLMEIYANGYVAYVGGGFGKGIHNILEPATFGLPTAFAANYKKFNEAIELIDKHGAFNVNTPLEFQKFITENLNIAQYTTNRNICSNYIKENIGATSIIYNELMKR